MTDVKTTNDWAMALHLSSLSWVITGLGIFVPIIIWQIKKEEMPEIDAHGKTYANWLISLFLYGMVCLVLTIVFIGLIGFLVLSLLAFVFPIIAGIKASNGEVWQYPLALRLIK